jgi:DNA repair protein SbcD/Mre11
MAVRILVAGDLHLGKSPGGIPGNPIECTTRFTWSRIVERCIGMDIDMLVLTGDIVDRDNRYFEATGLLQTGFLKLSKAGISVYMVAGNHDHDVLQQIFRGRNYENVHLLGSGGNWELSLYQKGGQVIQLAGWSFSSQYVYDNPLSGFNTLNISPDYPAIALLHCDITGGDSRYGPVGLQDFLNTRIDAWVLGHIHKPFVLNQQDPAVIYPGSPHAMSARETGPHGAVLLTVDDTGRLSHGFVPISPLRFENLPVNITGSDGIEDVRNRITRAVYLDSGTRIKEQEGLHWLVYDLTLEGEHIKPNEVSLWGEEGIKDFRHETEEGIIIIIRKLESLVSPVVDDLVRLAGTPSPAGKLAQTILAIEEGGSTPFLDDLVSAWKGKYQVMVNAPVYQPLRLTSQENGDSGRLALSHILRECRKLLAELMQQSAIKL